MSDDSFSFGRRAGETAHATHLLELPDDERAVVQWLLRHREASLETLSTELGRPAAELEAVLQRLSEKGFAEPAETETELKWRAHVPPRKGRSLPADLWKALE